MYVCTFSLHNRNYVIITSLIVCLIVIVAPSAEPQRVTGMSVNSETISLSWDQPPFDQQNGLIRQYLVNVTELDTGISFLQMSTNTEFTAYSLHPYYSYRFTIAAVTVGVGPYSIPITVQTDEDGKFKLPLFGKLCHTNLLRFVDF